MRSREWLIEQNLAKKGRGRLSLAAKEALAKAIAEGIAFDDIRGSVDGPTAIVVERRKVQAEPIVLNRERTREETTIYVLVHADKPGHSDVVIAFDTCAGCNQPISYCKHTIPKPPKWINSEEVYFSKPEM